MKRMALIIATALLLAPLCFGLGQRTAVQRVAVMAAVVDTDPNTLTFDWLYTQIKSYADEHELTPAQLQNATQRQVATALNLDANQRCKLGTCWNSIRGKIKQQWQADKEAADYQRFITAARDRILAVFPEAEFEREDRIVTIWLEGRQ